MFDYKIYTRLSGGYTIGFTHGECGFNLYVEELPTSYEIKKLICLAIAEQRGCDDAFAGQDYVNPYELPAMAEEYKKGFERGKATCYGW